MQIAERLKIDSSPTTTINDLIMQKKRAGEQVFDLGVGEPILETPKIIVEAAIQTMHAGKTNYSPVAGLSELNQSACQWLRDFYQAKYTEQEVITTCGGKFAIYATLQSILNQGDEVLVIAPYWVSYISMVQLAGGHAKIITTSENQQWKITGDDLEKNITPQTKLLILNNASNPTGTLYSKNELEEILRTAKKHNIIVLSDEVYSGLTYEGQFVSCGSFDEYKENVAVIQSCSKNFGMTGWRVGWAFGPTKIIKAIKTLQSQSITNTSTISQWTALTALNNAQAIMPIINQEMRHRRNIFIKTFNQLFPTPITSPASSLYAFIPLNSLKAGTTNSVQFCQQLLHQANVALIPGFAFGIEGYVRCSFGDKPEKIITALKALHQALQI